MRNATLIILFVLAAFFTLYGRNGIPDLLNFMAQKNELEQALRNIKSTIDSEKNILFGLSSSDEYLEKVAREDFGLSREGEVVYIFDPKDSKERIKSAVPNGGTGLKEDNIDSNVKPLAD